jgi:hypothetical protein
VHEPFGRNRTFAFVSPASEVVGPANDRVPDPQGLFYRCSGGAEVRRFNRLLIDAGLIRGL